MVKTIVVVSGLLVLLTAGLVQAQTREGFWIGLGVGVGTVGVETANSVTGAVGYLKLGGAINEKLLLGVESNAFYRNEMGLTFIHTNFSAVAYFYPDVVSGVYLKGGVGFSRFVTRAGGFSSPGNRSSVGAVFGLGYDIRVGDNLSITPLVNFNSGISNDGFGNTYVAEVGVGVTGH